MKKRLMALVCAAAMTAALFTGCSGNGNESKNEGTTQAAQGTEAVTTTENGATEAAGTEAASENGTHTVIDATGAEVEVPNSPKCIAIGAMVLPNMVYALQGTAENIAAIPPAAYSGWEMAILKDLAPELADVNTEICGDDYSVNVEACLEMGVDLVINWDSETDSAAQLKAVGIPCVLVSSAKDVDTLKALISLLGDTLNCQERTAEVLAWYAETEEYFAGKQDQINALSDEQKPRVLVIQNASKQKVYGKGMNVYITNLVGGQSITEAVEVSAPTMEEIIKFDPEIIVISNFDDSVPEDFYNNNIEGQDWSQISAVKNHKVYKIPVGLYRWAPPNTFEKPLFMRWFAQIVQPEIFNDYDIRETVKDFYAGYYNYDLSDAQLDQVLKTAVNADSQ